MEKKIKHPTRGTSLPFRTRNLDARVRRRIMSRSVHDESRSVHQPSMAGASFEFLVEITFPLLDLRGLKATQDLASS